MARPTRDYLAKIDGAFAVMSPAGQVLSTHASRGLALDQLRQNEYAKAKGDKDPPDAVRQPHEWTLQHARNRPNELASGKLPHTKNKPGTPAEDDKGALAAEAFPSESGPDGGKTSNSGPNGRAVGNDPSGDDDFLSAIGAGPTSSGRLK